MGVAQHRCCQSKVRGQFANSSFSLVPQVLEVKLKMSSFRSLLSGPFLSSAKDGLPELGKC